MKLYWKELLISLFICLVLPVLFVNLFADDNANRNANEEITKKDSGFIDVIMKDGSIQTLSMDEYLTGVLLAEMPMTFHNEALKAQAVAARTVAIYGITTHTKHKQGDICAEAACCQAYISADDYLSSGGTRENAQKAQKAVAETGNEVVTYNGELAQALYFSCSGGRTEAAVAVWGTDIPYLQTVDSPGEEGAAHFTDTVTYSTAEFCEKLGLSGDSRIDIESIRYTNSGSVDIIRINGKDFSGIQLRKNLNLRSTVFTVYAVGHVVTITTRGFGHRVGMSQYGAEAMAQTGCNYKQILSHYYKGVEVKNYILPPN
jgi:stage II sporulation protein D